MNHPSSTGAVLTLCFALGSRAEPAPPSAEASLPGTATTPARAATARPHAAPPLPRAATPPKGAAPLAPLGLSPELGYRLQKNWDFATVIRDDAALRAEFWTRYVYDGGALNHLNDEWSRYSDAENHEFDADGLALVARPAPSLTPGTITSGMLRSRWAGAYGVFEISMKVPSGRGLWPAFWLNPEDGRWPPEIDVVEIVDNGRDTPRRSFHFLHGIGKDHAEPALSLLDAREAYAPGVDYSRGFHVFAVEWTRDRVRHLVDGIPVVERRFRWLHDDGRDGGPAHVLVNLAVGGHWPGAPLEPRAFPARLNRLHPGLATVTL